MYKTLSESGNNISSEDIPQAEYDKIKSNLKNILQPDNFCGVCLDNERRMINFDCLYSNKQDTFGQMMKLVFGEMILDEIASKTVCQTCAEDIKQSYQQIIKVRNSGKIINSYLKQMEVQIESVHTMLESKNKCDFENTIILLQNVVDPKAAANQVLSKTEDTSFSDEEYYLDQDSDYTIESEVRKAKKIKTVNNTETTQEFVCEVCFKAFTTKLGVLKHIKTKHKDSNIDINLFARDLCLECSESPCVHEKYLQHVKEQQKSGCNKLKCPDCDYETLKKVNLIAHINKEHLDRFPFLCENCGHTFPSKKQHQYHMRLYHSLSCEYCDDLFLKLENLSEHQELCKTIQRPFNCDNCPGSFVTKERLIGHIKKHEYTLSCNMCTKKVKNEYFLIRHQYYAHTAKKDVRRKSNPVVKKDDQRPRFCSICPQVLYSLVDLKRHLAGHKSGEKHHCDTCKRVFDTRKKYNIHVTSQSHLKKVDPEAKFSFKCPQCEFTCKSSLSLENHTNSAHLKVKPYGCTACNKNFTTATNLRYHLERHQGLKKFQCKECSNMFTSSGGLKKHVLRHHSDKRPYPCDMCDKTFVCQSECNLHKLRNHSEKSVICPLCESKFHSMANLRAHIHKVHFKGTSLSEFMKTTSVSEEFYEMFRDHRTTF